MRIRFPNILDWSDLPRHWPLYVNSLLLILLIATVSLLHSDADHHSRYPEHHAKVSWLDERGYGYDSIPGPAEDLFLRYGYENSLPGWMLELLADPSWNQPYIEPRASTPMPTPSREELMELTRDRLSNPPDFEPRLPSEAQ